MIPEDPARATFAVIGAGGLGCPALLGLVAGGARRLVIIDGDRVDRSNLHRQVLYVDADDGVPKAHAAAARLRSLAPGLAIEVIDRRIAAGEVLGLLRGLPRHAVALECSDDPVLKFAVNDAALAVGAPAVIAGALRWRGQVMAVARGHACYRCVFEAPPRAVAACDGAGVIGAATGLFGHLQANLALALARGEAVAGVLTCMDLKTATLQRLAPAPRPGCPACARLGPRVDEPAPRRASATAP